LVDTRLNIKNFNNDFVIITSDDINLLASTGKAIFEQQLDFVDEVIVAEHEVCVQLNDRFDQSRLAELNNLRTVKTKEKKSYKLPIYFDENEDWDAVISYTRKSKAEIIAQILASELSVAMFGFLPGFVYLDGLDDTIHVPRKKIPSKYVKANSIAIGGKYLGIYSIDSPGGWHVVGRIPVSVLNVKSLPPVDFNLGDKIRLTSIDQEQYDRIVAEEISFKSYNF